MAITVTEVLSAGTDSVTLINEINDNGVDEEMNMDQSDINDMVQRNVDHLEIILAYEPDPENDFGRTIFGDGLIQCILAKTGVHRV